MNENRSLGLDSSVAPDLTLAGTNGPRRLRPGPGKRLLIIFYQEDDTPACGAQLSSFSNDFDLLNDLDTEVVAISTDDLTAHAKFAERLGGLPFPLLSDPGGLAAQAFGVWDAENRRAVRAVFVVDDSGKIMYASRHYSLGNVAAYAEVFSALGFEA